MKPKVKNWITQLENGSIKSNTLKILQRVHYHTFKGKGFTNVHELREELSISHQTLTSILSIIQDEGVIKTYDEIIIKNSFFQKISFANKHEFLDLMINRQQKKYLQWLKRGKNDFIDLMPQSIANEINKIFEDEEQ